jgi:hypothetical protein
MLRQPKAIYRVDSIDPNGQLISAWIPVPENLWVYFSTVEQAQQMKEAIQRDVASSDVSVVDGLGVALFIPVRYLTEDERMWLADGTTSKPDGMLRRYSEWTGGLHDRKLTTEKNGKTLTAQVIASDLVELHWK